MSKVSGPGASAGALIDDFAIYWPPLTGPSNHGVGSAFERDGSYKNGQPITNLFNAFVGGGFGELMALHSNNVPVGRIINAAGGLDRFTHTNAAFRFPVVQSGAGIPSLGSASVLPRPMRVIRLIWLMAMAANNPVGGFRVQITQAASPSVTDAYSFGVVGDGAGNFRWRTNRTGVAGTGTESINLALANPTDLHLFELQIINGVGGGSSTCALFVDGSSQLSRPFEAGGVLPLHTDWAGGNTMYYCVALGSDNGVGLVANAEVQYGPMSFIVSRYDRDGNLVEGAG